MADVQPEHGYTKLADEILEQMARIKLSPTQYRILFIVWRFTYGFNRKEHDLTLGFLSNATGCEKRQLQRELKGLEERKIIFQRVTNGVGRKIKFNKNHDEWVGKIAIGETTIGETDNGESDKGSIGETTNPTIGETDNQEIHSLQTSLKTNTSLSDMPAISFDPYIQIQDEFCDLHKKGDWQMKDKEREAIRVLLIEEIPPIFIIATMKKIHQQRLNEGDRITSFAYYVNPIISAWRSQTNQTPQQPLPKNNVTPLRGKSGKVPLQPFKPESKPLSSEELDDIRRLAQKLTEEGKNNGQTRSTPAIS